MKILVSVMTIPRNMVENAFSCYDTCENITSVWKVFANLRKTKRECSHITRVLTHITKK